MSGEALGVAAALLNVLREEPNSREGVQSIHDATVAKLKGDVDQVRMAFVAFYIRGFYRFSMRSSIRSQRQKSERKRFINGKLETVISNCLVLQRSTFTS